MGPPMRSLVRGDIDGFFGLALDNLVQLILINSLCRYVLGFPEELIYGRILPGHSNAGEIIIHDASHDFDVCTRRATRDFRQEDCLPY